MERIGVQLYTVREEMTRDAAATLAAVAQAGYVEVETAGTGNLDATQFAQALAENGLTAPSAHVPVHLLEQNPDGLLEAAETIGYRYLVVPWIPPEMRTLEGYRKLAAVLNRFGETSARVGVQTCYHNHDFEFATVDGMVPMQYLLDACDPRLVRFELDLYWATHAGADVRGMLAAQPERFPLCHVKDRAANGDMVDVGDGEIDFPALFAAGSGLAHYFVEHDQPQVPLQSIRRSAAALKALRF